MEKANNYENDGQGFGIAGLVTGIVALLLSFIPCFGGAAILIGGAAIVFGAIAVSRANTTNSPKGMGIAGVSLGSLAALIGILWMVFVVGAKGKFENHFEKIFNWVEHIDEIDVDIEDEFKDLESLEELERELDELEGVLQDVNDEVSGVLDTVVEEVHKEVKKGINEARKEIKKAKKDLEDEDWE